MSIETRQKLVDDPRLVLTHQSQRADLLDPDLTDTWLVQFLLTLIETAGHPIMVTAINSDHAPGTYHGDARGVDLWHADWAAVGDEKVVDVMLAARDIDCAGEPALVEVGLSGDAARMQSYVTFCCPNVFVEDWGDGNEHLHFAVGTPGG